MAGEFEFRLDVPDLNGLLAHVKEFNPKLATGLRRELRASGEEGIAAARQILAGPKPGAVSVSRQQLRRVVPKNGRRPYMARRNVYEHAEDKAGGGVDDLRQSIAAGLKTRVVAGKTRQGVQVKTSGPRNAGTNLAVMWASRRWRHPVFGGRGWMYQAGQNYFGPIWARQDSMRQRVERAVDDALQQMAQK